MLIEKPTTRNLAEAAARPEKDEKIDALTAAFIAKARQKRLFVISNCQTFGLVNALRALSNFQVEGYPVSDVKSDQRMSSEELARYDHILVAQQSVDVLPEDIRASSKVTLIPRIYFTGYHPDQVALFDVGDRGGKKVSIQNATLENSLIAFGGFRKGLSVRDTVALFNGKTYESLGYLDAAWDAARASLEGRFAAVKLTLDRYFFNWCRNGAFMHTPRHPRIECLADLAITVLEKLGHRPTERRAPIEDNLMLAGIYPVYHEIAEARGVAGSYLFKPGGTSYTMGLKDFVACSFKRYEKIGRDNIVSLPYEKPRLNRISEVLG